MNLGVLIELIKEVRPRRSLNFTMQEKTMNGTHTTQSTPLAPPSRRRRSGARWTRRMSVVGSAITVTLSAGIAFAAWSSTGVGTSSAKAGASQALTAGTATPSATLLYPTGAAGAPLAVTITNPNPYSVKVTSVVLALQSAPAGVSGANNASCTTVTAHVSTIAVNVSGANLLAIPANSTATYTTAGNVVTMASDSDDGCQNATFTFANATVTAVSG